MSLFKPTYTKLNKRTGKRVTRRSKKWYVKYKDENGLWQRRPAYTDRAASEELDRQLRTRYERMRAGLPVRAFEQESRPLHSHVQEYFRYLLDKGNTAKHAGQTKTRIAAVLNACQATVPAELTSSGVARVLADLRIAGAFGQRTSNYYLTAVKGFCRWLVDDGRIQLDPLAGLKSIRVIQSGRQRRALSDDDFARLLAATGRGVDRRGLDGRSRRLLYLTAAYTGLRAGELASLTAGSFDLAGSIPTVTVAAGYSKRRRRDTVPIPGFVAAELRDWLAAVLPTKVCWPGTWSRRAADMIGEDLEAAGIAAEAAGAVFDFHALRHQYGSLLAAAGVRPKAAQELMRHSTVNLTMNIYSHVPLADLAGTVNQLPAPPSARKKATGTSGGTSSAKSRRRPDDVT
jgi:integrase